MRALLGDVPDEHHRGAAGLGEPHELRRALAQLATRARRWWRRCRAARLDRVHHQQRGLALRGQREDGVQVRLRDDCEPLGRRSPSRCARSATWATDSSPLA